MADLIVRPSGDARAPQLRYHDCCGPTEYRTLTTFDEATAREVVNAGKAYFLFGDPWLNKEPTNA